MHIQISVPNLLSLTHLFVILTLCASYKENLDDSSKIFTNYNRAAEIEKHCSSYLSLASKLSPDANRGNRIKRELSFTYGDWEQENGHTTLMPFDQSNGFEHSLALKLVSFKVMDTSSIQHFENTVSLGGIMSIGISGQGSYFPTKSSSSFTMRPGLSLLRIAFEGVYLQSNDHENGKEHLMCLLGNTTLPIPEPFNYDWNDMFLDYSLLQDEQILLVLRYPQTFNLTRRSIRGEMRSLHQEGSLAYFDNVHISSQLNRHAVYQFSSESKSRSCDPYPYELDFAAYGANSFNNGSDFCSFLQKVAQRPFYLFGVENFRLLFQYLICEEETDSNNVQSARVSAVLRAFPASMSLDTVKSRTGLSNQTLSAEGSWNSLTGKLCMIGCHGVVDPGLNSKECNYQISFHFPSILSIKQRSLMLGTIHSNSNNDESNIFFPFLHSLRRPTYLKGLGLHNTPYYNYSKVELAAAIKSKNQHSKLFTLFKKLFFKYPTLVDGDDINRLSNKLNVHVNAIRHQSSNKHDRVYMQMEVLSLGTSHQHERKNLFGNPLLNISLHLTLSEGYWDENADSYPFFLEGVYDPLEGDMHLIGCRMFSQGIDCLMEVKVQYPSESIRWLKNPSVEMIITSQRSEEDLQHFKPITLRTQMIQYNEHQQDYEFRKILEGVLRLLISLAGAGIIWSQLIYMNADEDQTPYMSLGTLYILIFGYGAELIRASEIFFESKESASIRTWPYQLQNYQRVLMESMETLTKLLVLASLLLTINQYRKVSDAKNKPNAYGTNKSKPLRRISDASRRYLRIFICICLILSCLGGDLNLRYAFVILPATIVREYIWLTLKMQELFLLPQIFENKLWSNQVKPLRKTYYFGLTFLRLVIFFYDYIRDPVWDPFNNYNDGGGGINNQVGSDLLSFCLIMLSSPLVMIGLAFVVYIQQSWNYLKPRNA
ncbi:hypothetical protein HN51_057574 [Arachis hypogaea]|uniref:RING-type E3 ubiquitin transferase n=1 Tax=Arachis hypogaea TaxID=3818 RepID=A0A444WXG2_ARAHY|nr:uncharacterized protein LOC107620051 [Arachis ipaensis]XP_025684620.1 uncharacterized protein LOC112785365 [Arachis hypogaea]QHN80549.1 uncharacterized protein DS421_20g679150 [Arachis hypogaea]RYQ82147.1 hypothetical protein Ahy_B10g100747 [Arachis hypogaea]